MEALEVGVYLLSSGVWYVSLHINGRAVQAGTFEGLVDALRFAEELINTERTLQEEGND